MPRVRGHVFHRGSLERELVRPYEEAGRLAEFYRNMSEIPVQEIAVQAEPGVRVKSGLAPLLVRSRYGRLVDPETGELVFEARPRVQAYGRPESFQSKFTKYLVQTRSKNAPLEAVMRRQMQLDMFRSSVGVRVGSAPRSLPVMSVADCVGRYIRRRVVFAMTGGGRLGYSHAKRTLRSQYPC